MSCGCGGCVTAILFFVIFWLICFGISIDGNTWNLDLFPPRLWQMNKEAAEPEKAVTEKAPEESPEAAAEESETEKEKSESQ